MRSPTRIHTRDSPNLPSLALREAFVELTYDIWPVTWRADHLHARRQAGQEDPIRRAPTAHPQHEEEVGRGQQGISVAHAVAL